LTITSTEDNVNLYTTGNVSTTGDIYAKGEVNLDTHDGDVTIDGNITSSDNGVNLNTYDGDISTTGDISAKDEVNLDTFDGDVIINGNIISSESDVNLNTNGNVNTTGDIYAKGEVNLDTHNGDVSIDGNITSDKGDIDLNTYEGDVKTTGDIVSTEGDINVNTNGNVTTYGDITSTDGKINIDTHIGDVNTYGNIKSAEEEININTYNGDENVFGTIEAKKDVNITIDEGELNVSNAVMSEEEKINVNVYGDINDSGTNTYEGLYANEINIISEVGTIGNEDNSLRIGAVITDEQSVPNQSDPEQTVPVRHPELVSGSGSEVTIVNASNVESIYLESHSNVEVSKVEAPHEVNIETEKSVYAKAQENEASNITAEYIEIHAGANIGEENNRLVTETLHNKDLVNIEANGEIYLRQTGKNIFYSDYVINTGNGATNLLLPDNHVYIVNLDVYNPKLFKIDFINLKYKKEINIGYNDIKKLAVHPITVRKNTEDEDMEEKLELLRGFKENIILSPDMLSPFKQIIIPTRIISKLTDK
jgi:hypothetical protein